MNTIKIGAVVFSRIAIGCIILYQILITLLIFIRPELNPSWHYISDWGIGSSGPLLDMAFFINAIGSVALFFGLKPEVSGFWGTAGVILLLLCALCMVIAGFSRPDPGNHLFATTSGSIHYISTSAMLMLFPFAAVLINFNLALSNNAWQAFDYSLLWTSLLPLICFMIFAIFTIFDTGIRGHFAYGPGIHRGWSNRLLQLCYAIWICITAKRLIEKTAGPLSMRTP